MKWLSKKQPGRTFAVLSFLALSMTLAPAQRYQVGDLVEDLAFVKRSDGQPLKLRDLEGKIIFLDWFAWW